MKELREFFRDHPEAWFFVQRAPKNERAKEALRLVANGMSCAKAGAALGIGAQTVSVHCRVLHRLAKKSLEQDAFMHRMGFPIRAVNALTNEALASPDGPDPWHKRTAFDGTEESLRQVLSTHEGYSALLEVPNLGKKTLDDVLTLLGMERPKPPGVVKAERKDEIMRLWRAGLIDPGDAMAQLEKLT
jgi:hypothetical protein